jgi:hypothetical protein
MTTSVRSSFEDMNMNENSNSYKSSRTNRTEMSSTRSSLGGKSYRDVFDSKRSNNSSDRSSYSSKTESESTKSTGTNNSAITTDTYRGIKYYKNSKEEYKFKPEEIFVDSSKPCQVILESYGKEKTIGTHRFRTYEFPDNDREWHIPGQHLGSLYMNYCRELKSQPEPLKRINIGELVPDVAPLVINLELKFEHVILDMDDPEYEFSNNDVYDNRLSKEIVKFVQLLLEKNFNCNDERVFTSFVCDHEKPIKLTSNKSSVSASTSHDIEYYSTYMSFHFPFARMTLSNQDKLIKIPLIRLLKQYNVRKYLKIEPEGEWKDWIKTLKEFKYYPMYGSIPHPDIKYPLSLSVIYKKIGKNSDDSKYIYEDIDTDVFELSRHLHVSSGCIPYSYLSMLIGLEDFDDSKEYEGLDYVYPLYFSMFYWNVQLFPKSSESIRTVKDSVRQEQKNSSSQSAHVKFTRDIDEINRYVHMIKTSKIFSVNSSEFFPVWRDIGYIYHRYTNKEPTGLNLWLNFTQNYVKSKINVEDPNVIRENKNKIFSLPFDVDNDDIDIDRISSYMESGGSTYTPVEDKKEDKKSSPLSLGADSSEADTKLASPQKPKQTHTPTYKFQLPNLEEYARKFYSNGVVNNNLSVRTVAWYAQKYNPTSYQNYFKGKMKEAVDNALSMMTDTDIGMCIYHYFKLTLANISGKRNGWYKFENHHWKYLSSESTISNMISDTFVNMLHSLISENNTIIQTLNNSGERDRLETQNSNIMKLVMNLKKTCFKSKILTELAGRLYDNDAEFGLKMNSSVTITGVVNGIIETIDKDIFFRDGKPEDYVSKYSTTPYVKTLDWNSPSVIKLLIYLRQVFPDKDLRELIKRFLSSFFVAKNQEKKCFVFTGRGDNSKSVFIKLISNMLGEEYAVEGPTTMLTEKKRGSSGPNPEIARSKHTRALFLSEPGSEEKLDFGLIKNITGGDTFFARMLNDNGGSIKMTFKLILQTNDIPVGKNTDKQGQNRIFIIPFKARWSKEASRDIRKQFRDNNGNGHYLMDPDFDKNMPELGYAALWIAFQYWHIYATTGLNKCDSVDEEIKKHWHETDPFVQFFDEHIDIAYKTNDEGNNVVDKTSFVAIKDLTEQFNTYSFENNIPRITSIEIKRGFNRVFNNIPVKNRYYGFAFKNNTGSGENEI